jgi:hypothetical protein
LIDLFPACLGLTCLSVFSSFVQLMFGCFSVPFFGLLILQVD